MQRKYFNESKGNLLFPFNLSFEDLFSIPFWFFIIIIDMIWCAYVGSLYLKNLAVPEMHSTIELEASSKWVIHLLSFNLLYINACNHSKILIISPIRYLCLAAAAALIKYVEFVQSVSFASQSLKVWSTDYPPISHFIDLDTFAEWCIDLSFCL